MHSLRKNKYVSTKNSHFHVNLPHQEYEERGVDIPEEEEVVQPDLFPGEVVIASANNVLKFSPGSEHNTGISGTLFVTTLRITLHTTLPPTQQEQKLHQHSLSHLFLGPHDIELCLVSSVYLLDEHNTRKKPLSLDQALPDRVPGAQLNLKNFRVVNLSFKFSPPGEDGKVIRALLHHTSPASIDLLFLTPGRPPPVSYVPSFKNFHDWDCELKRTGCKGWRITQHNEHFNLCPSFPPALVVPDSLVDRDVEKASHHFRESRPLCWVWGAPGGAALVTMAQISPDIGDTISLNPRSFGQIKMSKLEDAAKSMENSLVKAVHRSHPNRQAPHLIDLDKELPQPLELHHASSKLRALHLPDGSAGSYLSRFENSRWLSFVSKALDVAARSAQFIAEQNITVILQEGSGRDSACIVSTLVEVLCDPYARTIRGLHATLAKHWVALGHPFTTRLGHTRHNKQLQGPCFLVLLDCLHQLCVQQPHQLEYSPQYLAALWSAAHCPLYTTCLFDSANARHSTISVLRRESRASPIELWDIWDWWASCKSQVHHNSSSITNNKVSRTGTLRADSSSSSSTTPKSTKPRKSISDNKTANGSSAAISDNSDIQGVKLKTYPVCEEDSLPQTSKKRSSPASCNSSPTSLSQETQHSSLTDQDNIRETGSESPTNSVEGVEEVRCSEACVTARRSFVSPLYVHQLFLSLLTPGAVDRIRDPVSIAHHTWAQICRLLFPQTTQHLPYDTSPDPVVPPVGAAHEARPPCKSKLPPQLQLDPSVPRLEPWVGLFGQWLPEQVVSGPAAGSNRTLTLPENPHLLFWDILYDMYATVDNYLRQPATSAGGGAAGLANLTERLAVNGAPLTATLVSPFASPSCSHQIP